MKAMSLPGWFWGEAVTTAVFLLNRAPTQSVNGMTPFEVWFGSKPPVHFLRTFGCVAHVKNGGKHLTKLEDRSTAMVFVGYEAGTKGYRLYNLTTQRVHISRDAVFEEERSWDWGADKGAGPNDDFDSFTVEYITVLGRREAPPSPPPPSIGAATPTNGTSSAPTTPTCGLEPRTTTSTLATPTCGTEPRTPALVEFVTPPSGVPDLDRDHDDDVPLRFRTLNNLLQASSPPVPADRTVTEELLVAIGEEPATAEEAKHVKEWRDAMIEEMA